MEALAENRRARFDYTILDSFEAGIELKGFEVKSVKSGRATLAGAFAVPRGTELYLMNADIPPYQTGNTPEGYDQKRSRRLLVKHEELRELISKLRSEKLTLIALKMYNKRGLVKVEIGLARPKKKGDRREAIRKREVTREINRTLRN